MRQHPSPDIKFNDFLSNQEQNILLNVQRSSLGIIHSNQVVHLHNLLAPRSSTTKNHTLFKMSAALEIG